LPRLAQKTLEDYPDLNIILNGPRGVYLVASKEARTVKNPKRP